MMVSLLLFELCGLCIRVGTLLLALYTLYTVIAPGPLELPSSNNMLVHADTDKETGQTQGAPATQTPHTPQR